MSPVILQGNDDCRSISRDPSRVGLVSGVVIGLDRRVFLHEVVAAAARAVDMRPALLTGPLRHKHIVKPRQAAMWVAFHLTGSTLPAIGRMFDRDHTTVLHAVRAIEARLKDATSDSADLIAGIAREINKLPDMRTLPATFVSAAALIAPTPPPAAELTRPTRPGKPVRIEQHTRPWFAYCDALFRAAFVAAHPELFAPSMRGAR